MLEDRQTGMLVGLAIGDTLGMVLEFKQRGSFTPIETFEEGGPFNLPLGYWTDDTSMALCLADSILDKQGYDSSDVMERYAKWRDEGYRSSTGVCFDIGTQVSSAINRYKEKPTVLTTDQRTTSAGNGCIMRLAPVVIASIAAGNNLQETMQLSAVSGRETHFSKLAEEATAIFGGLLYKAVSATTKEDVLQFGGLEHINSELISIIQQAKDKSVEELKPTGYVVDTLEVAMWAFMTTDNFKDGALIAVNMGGDSDTIGAVYGQLAGAFYGLEAIPLEWRNLLFQYDDIVRVASRLSQLKTFKVIKTRFDEDRDGVVLLYLNKENKMSDDSQPQEPLTEQDKAVLKSWSNVGSPGPAPSAPFAPTEEQKQKFQPIKTPRTISVNWTLDQGAYKNLQLGHTAREMEDKWNIYTEDNTVHFHRSWTGMELFRFTLLPAENGGFSVSEFEVEQDPERYTETDEQAIRNTLSEVLQAVLGVGV
jgi:ADP-ribosyl-[dinitrogen reductase] hydrolase